MEVEDHRLILGEEGAEVTIAEPVRIFGVRLQAIQIDHIDEADLRVRNALPKNGNGGKGLLRQDVACLDPGSKQARKIQDSTISRLSLQEPIRLLRRKMGSSRR